MWAEVIPFFGRKQKQQEQGDEHRKWQPALSVTLDRKVYRPGDSVIATIEIRNVPTEDCPAEAILVEDLVVQVRGCEKLDHQWLLLAKTQTTKSKRGERVFFESRGPVACNCYIGVESSQEYLIRSTLPKVLPPSYKGTSVRYFYYLTVNVQWSFVTRDNHGRNMVAVPMEKKVAFTVWTMPNRNGLTVDDIQFKESYNLGGIVPVSLIESEMYWKENTSFAEWSRAFGVLPSTEDDASSVGSESVAHSPVRGGSIDQSFERMILPPSITPRTSVNRTSSRRTSLTASTSDTCINGDKGPRIYKQNSMNRSSSENGTLFNGCVDDGFLSEQEDDHKQSGRPSVGGYLRGKAYNVRIDDHVLAQVSPRNPDSVYYFGDTVAGMITFPDESFRKCLEVSAVLEVREIVNPSYLHPSRKNSQVISKVQAEYFEIVADVSQTHFMFSIPMDGPASFSTPHMTVQWVIRFEFMSTPAAVDWTKYEHPLQIKERDRGDWVMPITVHAPLPRPVGGARRERVASSLRDFWLQSPKALEWPAETSPIAGSSNGHL